MRAPARHWKMALCSLSTGNSVAPEAFAACIISAPADTKASLLASATVRPASSRSEEHTSELQSLMRTSYSVFCLKKKKHSYNLMTHLFTLYLINTSH